MKSTAFLFLATLAIGCTLVFELSAQENEIISRQFNMSHGLTEDKVGKVIQDQQGFIWIKSGFGLNKYDGYNFTNYSNNPVSSVILDRRARIFCEDRQGRFWIGDRDAEATNGKEGLKNAEEILPDLIISDIMMPGMDGYQLCEKIKTNELTNHIPVILLTAKADRESKLTGLKTGADDYLSKPFDAEELRLIVKNHIEERRKMRERFSREISLEPTAMQVSSLDEKFLKKILALIESHMEDENFSIEEFGHEAGYSRMQLYRKIKGLAGQTPSQFVRTIRLKRAAQLLSSKTDNVTQIAYSVGFRSLAYFNKCFKEQFGMTPGKFSEENAHS